MGINNISYEDAVKKVQMFSYLQRVAKRCRKLIGDNVVHTNELRSCMRDTKKEINLLLSIIHAHKSARKLYAENQALRKELDEKK